MADNLTAELTGQALDALATGDKATADQRFAERDQHVKAHFGENGEAPPAPPAGEADVEAGVVFDSSVQSASRVLNSSDEGRALLLEVRDDAGLEQMLSSAKNAVGNFEAAFGHEVRASLDVPLLTADGAVYSLGDD